jgi:iron complex transport system permease protein
MESTAGGLQRKLTLVLIIVTSILIVALAFVSVMMGPAEISPGQALAIRADSLRHGVSTDGAYSASQAYIVMNLRLPRILSALVAGAVLAVSGAVFQSVFRNPMADPYVLGISSGASFGVALASLGGMIPAWAGSWGLPVSAWLGAMATAALIMFLAGGGGWSKTSLLLTGVAMNYLLSAAITLLMYLNQEHLDRVLFWTLGSFGSSDWTKLSVMAAFAVVTCVPLLSMHRELDMMLLDETTATSSGLSTRAWRMLLLAIATASVASVVSFCGVIGFIGLMAPHLVRMTIGPGHKRLLPCSMIVGAFLMLLSDTLARTVMGTTELPVGVVTSIAGAPLFIILLRHTISRRRR